MKKALFSVLALALGALVQTNASADLTTVSQAQVVSTVKPPTYAFTTIHGTVTVPAAAGLSSQLANIKCSDLVVSATSTAIEQVTTDGFTLSHPRWIRSDVASGNWATGCAYTIIVPPNSPFTLSASGKSGPTAPCDYFGTTMTGTGGQHRLKAADSKTQNFTVTTFTCGYIH